jgi:chorismate mutase
MALPAQLTALRAEIDRVDLELLDALARRRAVVARIAQVKHAHALAGHDPVREAEMRSALLRQARQRAVPETLVNAVLDAILQDSRGVVE